MRDVSPNAEPVQPLDEYLLEKAGALGPVNDWTDMCAHLLDTLDCMIATGSTAPELLQGSPFYFLNAISARMGFLGGMIDVAQQQSESMDADPIRDADLTPQLDARSQVVRTVAQERVSLWARGINPDTYYAAELAEAVGKGLGTEQG